MEKQSDKINQYKARLLELIEEMEQTKAIGERRDKITETFFGKIMSLLGIEIWEIQENKQLPICLQDIEGKIKKAIETFFPKVDQALAKAILTNENRAYEAVDKFFTGNSQVSFGLLFTQAIWNIYRNSIKHEKKEKTKKAELTLIKALKYKKIPDNEKISLLKNIFSTKDFNESTKLKNTLKEDFDTSFWIIFVDKIRDRNQNEVIVNVTEFLQELFVDWKELFPNLEEKLIKNKEVRQNNADDIYQTRKVYTAKKQEVLFLNKYQGKEKKLLNDLLFGNNLLKINRIDILLKNLDHPVVQHEDMFEEILNFMLKNLQNKIVRSQKDKMLEAYHKLIDLNPEKAKQFTKEMLHLFPKLEGKRVRRPRTNKVWKEMPNARPIDRQTYDVTEFWRKTGGNPKKRKRK